MAWFVDPAARVRAQGGGRRKWRCLLALFHTHTVYACSMQEALEIDRSFGALLVPLAFFIIIFFSVLFCFCTVFFLACPWILVLCPHLFSRNWHNLKCSLILFYLGWTLEFSVYCFYIVLGQTRSSIENQIQRKWLGVPDGSLVRYCVLANWVAKHLHVQGIYYILI